MSFKPEIKVLNEDKWHANGVAFATFEEAYDWAVDRKRRWILVKDIRVVQSDEAVNYTWQDGALLPVVLAPLPPNFDTKPGHDEHGAYTGEFDPIDYANGGDGKVY